MNAIKRFFRVCRLMANVKGGLVASGAKIGLGRSEMFWRWRDQLYQLGGLLAKSTEKVEYHLADCDKTLIAVEIRFDGGQTAWLWRDDPK